MKQQYQTRYELLHENYQKWLTGFTRHAVSWGVCHPNIYYFHNLTPGWVSFNGEKPEIAIVPQSLHRLIYGPDKRSSPSLDDDLVVNLCTSEHLLVHHPMSVYRCCKTAQTTARCHRGIYTVVKKRTTGILFFSVPAVYSHSQYIFLPKATTPVHSRWHSLPGT